MEKNNSKYIDYLPMAGYLGFFLLQLVLGIILITNIMPPVLTPGYPVYDPLTFPDLFILLAFNIPTFYLIYLALKKTKAQK